MRTGPSNIQVKRSSRIGFIASSTPTLRLNSTSRFTTTHWLCPQIFRSKVGYNNLWSIFSSKTRSVNNWFQWSRKDNSMAHRLRDLQQFWSWLLFTSGVDLNSCGWLNPFQEWEMTRSWSSIWWMATSNSAITSKMHWNKGLIKREEKKKSRS